MKAKDPHFVALGRKGGAKSGGLRPGAGRKRGSEPRCPCGLMTEKRAKARAHHCQ